MSDSTCESCRTEVQRHEGGVSLGSIDKGSRFLCLPCYNATMAEHAGVEFEDPRFQPVVLNDIDDQPHEFHFGTRLLGDRVAVDAHEVRGGERKGYEFQHVAFDPEIEPLALIQPLLEKMRRALSRKHVEPTDYGWHITKPDVVRGRIDCDLDGDFGERMPLVVIDGREFTWEQFGRMFMSYEGWQFRVEIKDPSEEV